MKYYRLTPQQMNIWNLQKVYEGTAIANQCGAVFFHEQVSLEQICDTLKIIVQKQTGLRLRFQDGKVLRQYISDDKDISIPVLIFEDESELDAYASKVASTRLFEKDQPLYRFFAFRVKNQYGVLAVLSHMITDAWSFSLLVNYLDSQLRNNEIPVGDYTSYINKSERYNLSARSQRDADYWKSKYRACPEMSFIRPESDNTNVVDARRIQKKIQERLNTAIRGYCDKNSISLAVLFETAVMIYLSKINPSNKTITIGIPVLNRADLKEKKTIGMFISTMPLTVEIDEAMTVKTILQQVTAAKTEVFCHQQYPYSDILRSLREQQLFDGNLYEVMVSFQNAKIKTKTSTKWYFNGYSEVPLVIHIDDRDGEGLYSITMDYQVSLFPQEEEVEYLYHRLEYILEQITGDPKIVLRDVSILPEEEKNVLLKRFNDTFADYPRDKCVHELFSEQAKRTPDKTALVFENKEFTYRELDHMSDALAKKLKKSDGGPERNEVIPIISKKDWKMIVAMLGVLKAGGAYLHISSDYPIDRIYTMIQTAGSKTILHYGYKEWNELKIKIEGDKNNKRDLINLDSVDYDDNEPIHNKNQPQDLCYVIFTSGSTGEPKGALIRHRNLLNFLNNNRHNQYQRAFCQKSECVLADAESVFDLSIFEIVLSLVNGKTIVLSKGKSSADDLAKLIETYHVDSILSTPTKLSLWLADATFQKAFSGVRLLMCGAEAFTDELYRRIRQNSAVEIYNGYGPTEITIACCFKEIE